jgi:lysophospholipase L1-like esterase
MDLLHTAGQARFERHGDHHHERHADVDRGDRSDVVHIDANGVPIPNPSNGMTLTITASSTPVAQNRVLTAINSGGASLPGTVPYTPLPLITSGYDIMVVAGLSNSIGYLSPPDASLDAADPRILQMTVAGTLDLAREPLIGGNTNSIGPSLTFCKQYLTKIAADRKVIIVMTSINGTGMYTDQWHPYDNKDVPLGSVNTAGATTWGNLFRRSLDMTQTVLSNPLVTNAKLGAIMWVQGEADFNRPPANYIASLYALIVKYRNAFSTVTGASTCPFVIGQMVPEVAGNNAITAVQVALPNVVQYTGFGPMSTGMGYQNAKDGLHYNALGYRQLGRTMATASTRPS